MRRIASRLLLLGLALAVLVFVIRQAGSPSDALATLDDIRAEGNPEHEAFRVNEAVRVTLDASGSFEGGEADTALAAHGWLVHRETGNVVWRMRPARRPERGTYFLMRDTLALRPGTYDAYYAALGVPEARTTTTGGSFRDRLGDALRGGGKGWVGDAARWHFLVRFAPGEDRSRAEQISDDIPEADDLVWGTGPARSNDLHEVVLRAKEPVRVRLEALFEAAGHVTRDSAYLVSTGGDTLWVARPSASSHAGGSLLNRRRTDTLSLEPGLYRAVYRADGSHAYDDWEANPPWEPWRWGLRISPADSASRAGGIAPADPLNDLPRLASIECADTPSTTRTVRFEVLERLEVTLVGVGEFINGDGYDYGELLRGEDTVWDMRRDSRSPAGGADKNERAEETLWLDPGTYTLRYTTDGSHHCRSFNQEAPDREDFWGVVLLSTDGREGGDRLRLVEDAPAIPQDALARIVGVGDNENRTATFELDRATDACVLALGEINDTNRYDWGAVVGPTAWSLTMRNSFHDGGSTFNRMSVAHLTLQPGRYTVRYQTDTNHSAAGWVNEAPNHPEYWGIQVWRAPEGASEMPDPRRACIPPGLDVPSDYLAQSGEDAETLTGSSDGPLERNPQLVGGLNGLARRVEYPEDAQRDGVGGLVQVRFVVEADGDVDEAECLGSPDERLCDAAIEAVEGSEFRPAMQRGQPVRVRYTLPVNFQQ